MTHDAPVYTSLLLKAEKRSPKNPVAEEGAAHCLKHVRSLPASRISGEADSARLDSIDDIDQLDRLFAAPDRSPTIWLSDLCGDHDS